MPLVSFYCKEGSYGMVDVNCFRKATCLVLALASLTFSLGGCASFLGEVNDNTSSSHSKGTIGSVGVSSDENDSFSTSNMSGTTGDTDPIGVPVTTEKYTQVPAVSDQALSFLTFDGGNAQTTMDLVNGMVSYYQPAIWNLVSADRSDLSAWNQLFASDYQVVAPDTEALGETQKVNLIFYKKDLFSLEKSASVWLSSTPAVASLAESASDYDTCTYALLKNGQGNSLAVFCTALDSQEAARSRQIVYLYRKYSCYISYFPTIVTGNLALTREDSDYTVLTDGGKLTDSGIDGGTNYLMTSCATVQSPCLVSDGSGATALYGQIQLEETPYTLDLSGKMICLTFDDGPRLDNSNGTQYSHAVIAALKKYNAKATFFVLGNRLEGKSARDILAEEYALGYEIGNHTYDHTSYTKMTAEGLTSALQKTDELIKQATGGMPSTLLRAPGGSYKTSAVLDLPQIYWSIDTRDWDSAGGVTSADVLAEIQTKARDGSIILEHDIQPNSTTIVETIVQWLAENEYQMVTVSELYEFHDIQMDGNTVYRSLKNYSSMVG
jgi:peptidoglycan/xylan/chitin deacetylase (PgdA/CDA1 family)